MSKQTVDFFGDLAFSFWQVPQLFDSSHGVRRWWVENGHLPSWDFRIFKRFLNVHLDWNLKKGQQKAMLPPCKNFCGRLCQHMTQRLMIAEKKQDLLF